MTNNYDRIARYHDGLSRFVFFRSQVNAQIDQLKYIPEKSTILIVGGGTGWILEELAKVHPSGLHIVYVEISEKMIELSKARNSGSNVVEFINKPIEDFTSPTSFDIISTPFLFDNFQKEKAELVFSLLTSLLKRGGRWLFVDFTLEQKKGKYWKSAFLKIMYRFFRTIGIVESSRLINMKPYFEVMNYNKLEEKLYYRGFIQSIIYQNDSEG